MLSENCRLALIYHYLNEEVYISAPSIINYLQVLEVELNQSDNPASANAIRVLHEAFQQVADEYREEVS